MDTNADRRREVRNIIDSPNVKLLIDAGQLRSFDTSMSRIECEEHLLDRTTTEIIISLTRAMIFYGQDEIKTFLSDKIESLLVYTRH